jgi:hypothetical protein
MSMAIEGADTAAGPLRALLAVWVDDVGAAGRVDDAWALKDAVSAAGRAAYGAPRYHPFKMPR